MISPDRLRREISEPRSLFPEVKNWLKVIKNKLKTESSVNPWGFGDTVANFDPAAIRPFLTEVEAQAQLLKPAEAEPLQPKAVFEKIRQELTTWLASNPEASDQLIDQRLTEYAPRVFALVREVFHQELNLKPYDVQLAASLALHEGSMADIPTGTGKTIIAATAAILNSLIDQGVHIVVPNDYLGRRDMEKMGKIYNALGLSAAFLGKDDELAFILVPPNSDQADNKSPQQNAPIPCTPRMALSADIVYCENNALPFAYLRDQCAKKSDEIRLDYKHGKPLMPRFIIFDEVDSIVDQTSPLILADQLIEPINEPLLAACQKIVIGLTDKYSLGRKLNQLDDKIALLTKRAEQATLKSDNYQKQVLEKQLRVTQEEFSALEKKYHAADHHYDFHANDRSISLTDEGWDLIASRMKHSPQLHTLGLNPDQEEIWQNDEFQAHLQLALKANYSLQRDVDYIVVDDQVIIIDPTTGRIQPNSHYTQGLHGALSIKEGLPLMEQPEVSAVTTLFGFYAENHHKVAGMSGSLTPQITEMFAHLFHTKAVSFPPHHLFQLLNKVGAKEPLIASAVQNSDGSVVLEYRVGDQVFREINTFSPQIHDDESGQIQAIVQEIQTISQAGRPILVATQTIEQSERISAALKKSGIVHELLNGRPENAKEESLIINEAARLDSEGYGKIVIATNMAGRGTDVVLGGNVKEIFANTLQNSISELLELEKITILAEMKTRFPEASENSLLKSIDKALKQRAQVLTDRILTINDELVLKQIFAGTGISNETLEAILAAFNLPDQTETIIENGGLHVIVCPQATSATAGWINRLIKQMSGRAARNGEPGSRSIHFNGLEIKEVINKSRVQKLVTKLRNALEPGSASRLTSQVLEKIIALADDAEYNQLASTLKSIEQTRLAQKILAELMNQRLRIFQVGESELGQILTEFWQKYQAYQDKQPNNQLAFDFNLVDKDEQEKLRGKLLAYLDRVRNSFAIYLTDTLRHQAQALAFSGSKPTVGINKLIKNIFAEIDLSELEDLFTELQ